MLRRIAILIMTLLALLVVGLFVSGTTGSASAAPITCPGGQVATKTDGGWDCVNQGGNTSNAENPKNPNAGKGFF